VPTSHLTVLEGSVVDRFHFDADPDQEPTFHLDADPDPDQDSDLDPDHIPQILRMMEIGFLKIFYSL
jgi:hypothetical protein